MKKINLKSLTKDLLKIGAILGYVYVVVKANKTNVTASSFNRSNYSYGKDVIKSLEDAAMDCVFDSDRVDYARKIKEYASDKGEDVKYYASKALGRIAEECVFSSDRKTILNLMTTL